MNEKGKGKKYQERDRMNKIVLRNRQKKNDFFR